MKHKLTAICFWDDDESVAFYRVVGNKTRYTVYRPSDGLIDRLGKIVGLRDSRNVGKINWAVWGWNYTTQ